MATIYDVAKAASVTAATVSNVLTGKGAVSPKTRERVEAAIRALGYRPNMLARSLATRQTYTLGLVLPNIANPFYPEIALEVEHTARQHGYSVLLCNTGNDEAVGRTYLQQLISRQVDGVIVMPGGIGLDDLLAATRGGTQLVLCNWEEQDELPALPSVGVSFFEAGQLAAAHLLGGGHARIGVVADASVPHTRHTERVAGFAATLAAAGSAWDQALLWRGDSSIASGYAAVQALLALPAPPTALFCTNDLMALGALEGARAMGVAVPDRLSIIGLDDIAIGRHTYPALTTVAIPKRQIAARAAGLLIACLAGEAPPAEPQLFSPATIVRGSTAAIGPPRPALADARLAGLLFRHFLDPAPASSAAAASASSATAPQRREAL